MDLFVSHPISWLAGHGEVQLALRQGISEGQVVVAILRLLFGQGDLETSMSASISLSKTKKNA